MRNIYRSISQTIEKTMPKINAKYLKSYNEMRMEQSSKRLSVFLLFITIHCILAIITHALVYPSMIHTNFEQQVSNLYIAYTIVYLILLILATFLSKLYRQNLANNKRISNLIYILAISGMIINDLVTRINFSNIFNSTLFLSGALILALVPMFNQIFVILVLMLYLTSHIAAGSFPDDGGQFVWLGAIYLTSLAILSYIVSLISKRRYIIDFLQSQQMMEVHTQLERYNKELKKISDTDPLTKISNRRAFEEYYERTWTENSAGDSEIFIFMFDVDNFKKYNDHFGHLDGDECLIKISNCIQAHFRRRSDIFARYGGEEFIIALPGADADTAGDIATRIKESVAMKDFKINKPKKLQIKITASFGVAARLGGGKDLQMLINHADAALYGAKKAGRDCVVKAV